jgi:hypothetical protein
VTIWGGRQSEFNLQRPKLYRTPNNREAQLVTDSSICVLCHFYGQMSISCLRKHITGQLKYKCHTYSHHQNVTSGKQFLYKVLQWNKPIALTCRLVLRSHILAQFVVHKLSLEWHFVIHTYILVHIVINRLDNQESQVTISGKTRICSPQSPH